MNEISADHVAMLLHPTLGFFHFEDGSTDELEAGLSMWRVVNWEGTEYSAHRTEAEARAVAADYMYRYDLEDELRIERLAFVWTDADMTDTTSELGEGAA